MKIFYFFFGLVYVYHSIITIIYFHTIAESIGGVLLAIIHFLVF